MKRNQDTSFFVHEKNQGSYLSNWCRIVISLTLSIITLSMFDWCTLLSHHKTQMTSVLNTMQSTCYSCSRDHFENLARLRESRPHGSTMAGILSKNFEAYFCLLNCCKDNSNKTMAFTLRADGKAFLLN